MLAQHAPGLAFPLVALLAPTALGDVLTVGPAGDFAQIQPAVDAALDGDTILVAPGTHERFEIVAKDVDVIGSGVHSTVVHHTVPFLTLESTAITVAGAPAGAECRLAGFSVVYEEEFGSAGMPIRLENCAGRVLLADLDVTLEPGDDEASAQPFGAIDVRDCDVVVLSSVRVELDTSTAEFPALFEITNGVSAVLAADSSLWISDSLLRGGHAPAALDVFGTGPKTGFGGAGLHLFGAEAWVSTTTFEGGPVDTSGPFSAPIGDSVGGAGAWIENGSRLTVSAGCSFTGGDVLFDGFQPMPGPALGIFGGSEATFSAGTSFAAGDGPDGPGFLYSEDLTGSKTYTLEPLLSLFAEPDTLPATIPTVLRLFLEGEPGATVVLGLTFELATPLPFPGSIETAALQDPFTVRLVGPFALDAQGDGVLATGVPGLAAGTPLVLQAYDTDFLGTTASPPVAITAIP